MRKTTKRQLHDLQPPLFLVWAVLATFGCSLVIELMHFLRCGMFELDDLLNNTTPSTDGLVI